MPPITAVVPFMATLLEACCLLTVSLTSSLDDMPSRRASMASVQNYATTSSMMTVLGLKCVFLHHDITCGTVVAVFVYAPEGIKPLHLFQRLFDGRQQHKQRRVASAISQPFPSVSFYH